MSIPLEKKATQILEYVDRQIRRWSQRDIITWPTPLENINKIEYQTRIKTGLKRKIQKILTILEYRQMTSTSSRMSRTQTVNNKPTVRFKINDRVDYFKYWASWLKKKNINKDASIFFQKSLLFLYFRKSEYNQYRISFFCVL